DTVLSEDEKAFNYTVLYGKDTNIDEVLAACKRYPMMAQHQLVIIREAQELSRSVDQLESYINQPQPTTVLVLCYKYKSIDKRTKFYKSLAKNAAVFQSKTLYDNQVPEWIFSFYAEQNKPIEPKAVQMLAEYLGNELSKLENELTKLSLACADNDKITSVDVEKHIGISKNFNVFELRKALAYKDIEKIFRILAYFKESPKDHSIYMTLGQLYAFLKSVYMYHTAPDKSKFAVAKHIGVNPFFVEEYRIAAQNLPMKQLSFALSVLKRVDLQSKGLGAQQVDAYELLEEGIAEILCYPRVSKFPAI
ncbi:MAG: DNA polymerase III subunit delta, partial [Flavobacteriaceae bacterium]|nr:DNA polymerase III subunit delta [Flavobacteriaceae bacterium]